MDPEILKSEGVKLEPATKRHARELAQCMRRKDAAECASAGWVTPEAGVRRSINHSWETGGEAYAARKDGKLLCAFGVAVLPQYQVAWMIVSVHAEQRKPFWWLRCCKVVLGRFRDSYPELFNMIYGQHAEALVHAKRLGFRVGAPEKFGKRGDLFCPALLSTKKIVTEGSGLWTP